MDGVTGPQLSVVIPVGPDDTAWRELLSQLAPQLDARSELLVVATTAEPAEFAPRRPSEVTPTHWRWLSCPPGRAAQQNIGATAATGRFLWFLHADSRVEPDAMPEILARCAADPTSLWYFDLHFLPDGPSQMWLNELGARFRSRVLGLPFGDQGLALPRDIFFRLGGFRADLRYGEDHLLVWSARRAGVHVRPVRRIISTSARRYQQRGWLRTTLVHFWLTWRQALPEVTAWLRQR